MNMMERTSNKSFMSNLELQSLCYWYKRAPIQNTSIKYNNVLKIMQNSVYKSDITDTNDQYFPNIIQRPHSNFKDRVILRRIFEHWKMYVIHKLHTRRATYKADYFYSKKLQKKVLNALSKNVLLKWTQIVSSLNNSNKKCIISANYTKAASHYANVLVRRFFASWRKYVELERKESFLLKEAIIFNNTRCLRNCIMHWKIYIKQRRKKHVKENLAHRFYATNLLRKCMKTWIEASNVAFLQQQIKTATLHYEQKLLTKFFNFWKMYHELKVQEANKNEYVREFRRTKLLKLYFEQFVTYTNQSITDKIAKEKAELFYNTKCLQRALFAWIEWHNKIAQDDIKINEIRSMLENKTKSTIFFKWRLYVYERKCKKRKLFLSQTFYKRKLLITVLRKLRDYNAYRKEKKKNLSYLNDKCQIIIEQLQIICIEKWRKALYITVQEKRKLSQASKLWERNLTRTYFYHWKDFSRKYKVKALRKKKLYDLASGFLLKRYISHWHDKLQDVLEIRRKEVVAVSMVNHKILRKYLLVWKQYVIEKLEMRNRIEAAKELHKKLLLHEGLQEILRNSLRNIDYKNSMQLEDAAMRSLKNLEILKEYFNKWYFLIYLKQKSKGLNKLVTNNSPRFLHFQMSDDCTLDEIENRSLDVPEYIKKTTISNISNSFVTFTPENWSFNF